MSITLKDISTRELKQRLGTIRLNHEDDSERLKGDGGFLKRIGIASRQVKGGSYECAAATVDELTAELATRPHIPGRAEGKVLRRLIAQTGWTAEQLRAHPKFGMQLADAQYPYRREISAKDAPFFAKVHGKRFGSTYKVVK